MRVLGSVFFSVVGVSQSFHDVFSFPEFIPGTEPYQSM